LDRICTLAERGRHKTCTIFASSPLAASSPFQSRAIAPGVQIQSLNCSTS
jgi:hypothetical protein